MVFQDPTPTHPTPVLAADEPDPVDEPASETEPDHTAEPAHKADPDHKAEPADETEPDHEAEPNPWTEPDPWTEPASRPEAPSWPEAIPWPNAAHEPESDHETESDREAEAAHEAEPPRWVEPIPWVEPIHEAEPPPWAWSAQKTEPTAATSAVAAPPASRTGRPVWPLITLAVLLVLAVALIVRNLASGSGDDQRVAVALDGRQTAVIHIDSGADSLVVGTADLGGDLAVVTTPGGDGSGVRPRAQMDGDRLRVWTEDAGAADSGAAVQIDVRIAAGVRWDVVVNKGAKRIHLALGSGQVNLVETHGGADLIDFTLPNPVGEQTVRIQAGLATAALHVPPSLPSKITFGSGAGRATVDGGQRQGIARGTTLYGASGRDTEDPAGYTSAKDRLLVDVVAGVGTLTLDRT